MELSKHAKRVAVGEYLSEFEGKGEDVYDRIMAEESDSDPEDWDYVTIWGAFDNCSADTLQGNMETLAQSVQEAIDEAVKEALAKRDGVTGD